MQLDVLPELGRADSNKVNNPELSVFWFLERSQTLLANLLCSLKQAFNVNSSVACTVQPEKLVVLSALLFIHNCLMSFSQRILPLLIPLWHVPYGLKSLLYFAATYSALLLPYCLMSFSRRILPLLIPLWHVPYSLKSLLYFAATFLLCSYLTAWCLSHGGYCHC